MVLFFRSVLKEFVEKDLVVLTITCSIFTVSSHVEIFFHHFPFSHILLCGQTCK